ncbi:hypothetical protein BO71DRAFT_317908 [Aspergillus ellipticus CBS 707.79]|uniref:Uncharacterized protein n=1 Tax=Aspergillus ellipticus CBS 707.79 TaxID=1448320 RepID=A0A319DJP1_9EURO|nr:hypothetical protein BO71DRAFT_317908 [Aspergillus ellipticus CBS 707.79]
MASIRLRKAFHYPNDSDDDEHSREELDEEEQDRMIDQLKMLNNRRNSKYSVFFAAIPFLSSFTNVPPILSESSSLCERCLSFVSILSLLATAYTMKFLPFHRPDSRGKIPIMAVDARTRVQWCLLPMNAIICTLLALTYALCPRAESWLIIQPITYLVPGAMFVAVLIARKVMLSVDLKELEDLRYTYKGA